jgi:nitrite reductase/ring-hydroxylating ferredoxin subunit
VCPSADLKERGFVSIDVRYRGRPHSAIVFRYEANVYAYLNQCVHMPRRLDCERDTIFDADKALLRCSMHGIVYRPESGESLSTLCHGERLTALRVEEAGDRIVLRDKRLSGP